MPWRYALCLMLMSLFTGWLAKEPENEQIDQEYILKIQQSDLPPKVLHAEPLYIDLIRDLGARKGEAEWNLGFGMQDRRRFVEYHTLIEYEWALVDRLGVEIELPFFFSTTPTKCRMMIL